ncbi:MAG: cytochrome c oxidase assembly protein [Alphaproteobacteria bacterium]
MSEPNNKTKNQKNGRVVVALVVVVLFMGGVSLASVPIYRAFCQVTGYGGTPATNAPLEITSATSDIAPDAAATRITVRFNADVARDLNWTFAPLERSVQVVPGEIKEALYTARNTGQSDVVGQATFNVTPAKVGKYFHKVQCFCFNEQPLAVGDDATFDVQYFVDPQMLQDPTTQEVRTITLSYTFHYLEDMTASTPEHDHASHDHNDHAYKAEPQTESQTDPQTEPQAKL